MPRSTDFQKTLKEPDEKEQSKVDGLDTCSLCKQKKNLRVSHVIPRFVSEWLKTTSSTGFLRGIVEPNRRVQDLAKLKMLCENCEERFSKLETYFANEVFFPFFEDRHRPFKYDDRLQKFAMSINWRGLLISYDEFKQDTPSLCKYVDKAEETWRRYLLGDSQDPGHYEHHVFFLDYVKEGKDLPIGFQWYTLRAVDTTLVSNEKKVFAYTKFPWMIFVSSIYPTHLEGWYGTRIDKIGEISEPQRIENGDFGTFLINRAKMSFGNISSGEPSDRILESLVKKPERVLTSESLQVHLAEAERARKAEKEKLPAAVRDLVEIVERAIEDSNLGQAEKNYRKWGRSIVADTLTRMHEDDALKLHSLIETTIKKSKISSEDAQCDFETSEVVMVFMVNLYYTKDEQRQRVDDELQRLLENKKPNDRRCFIAFSFNPFEADLPFETAFFIS